MRPLALVFLLPLGGCLTPRSMMLGQTAAPLGRGGAEVGVGTGIGYAFQRTTTPGTTGQSTSAQVWTVPAVEGNATFGLGDHVGVNAHFSSAGIQPGLKITVNRPRAAAHFAFLPQFALGYAHVRSATNVTDSGGLQTEVGPTSTGVFTFMLGLKLLVSHRSGFYAGAGADFIATRANRNATAGTGGMTVPTGDASSSLQLSISANVGFSISVGWVRIRPEIGFAVQPWLTSSAHSETATVSGSGGFGWALLPGFSLVAATPRAPNDDGAEDEKNLGPSDDNSGDREDREEREE